MPSKSITPDFDDEAWAEGMQQEQKGRTGKSALARPWWPPAASDMADLDALKELEYKDKHVKRMRKAKAKHRTDLSASDWTKQRYFDKWSSDLKPRLIAEATRLPPIVADSEIRSVEEFRARFETPREPCVITGCADKWKARTEWTLPRLLERYPKTKFKCGEDDDGFSIKVKLDTFVRYMQHQQDDSPLYIFDTSFERQCPELFSEFKVPRVFPEDLFELVGDRRRPPHRWFLVGPERSGTTVHVDPLETSAWNTLLTGRKLWIMFSPECSKQVVKGKKYMRKDGDDEAIDYFAYMLRHIELELERGTRVYHFIQYPGSTVFVPHGWWHAVLNLDDTVAVTQNYVSSVNFPHVWRSTRVERRKMARKWLSILEETRPDLHALARKLDKEDGYDLEGEIRKRKEEKMKRAKKQRDR